MMPAETYPQHTHIETHKSNASSAATDTEHHHGGDCSGQGAGRMICSADRGLLCDVCMCEMGVCVPEMKCGVSLSAPSVSFYLGHTHTPACVHAKSVHFYHCLCITDNIKSNQKKFTFLKKM